MDRLVQSMTYLSDNWLVGTHGGVYAVNDQGTWERLGPYQFMVSAFERNDQRLLAATGGGLWEVREARWLQRHDETLTEVLDVIDDGHRMVVASAYGVAFGTTEPSEATRWEWLSKDLTVNERFTNAILRLDENRLLAGTDAGVIIYDSATGWETTSLKNTPVRSFARWQDGYVLAADSGIWSSDDGTDWRAVHTDGAAYAVAVTPDTLLAGTENGVFVSTDAGHWQAAGLAGMRIGAVAGSQVDAGHWYVGGVPGGLWITEDRGRAWVAVPEIRGEVEAISAPGGRG